MVANIWESREFDIEFQLNGSDRHQEMNYLLSAGGNFIELINPQESMDLEDNVIDVTKLDCGVIVNYGFAIKAGTFVHADQDLAINKITDKLIEIIESRNFLAEVCNCSMAMGELFWFKMQIHNLEVEGFMPSSKLKQRLEKINSLLSSKNNIQDEDLQIAYITKKMY